MRHQRAEDIFDVVLERVKECRLQLQSAGSSFPDGMPHGGGLSIVGNRAAEYIGDFALAGKKALLGSDDAVGLLAARLERGWSVEELARRAGVDWHSVRTAERGGNLSVHIAYLIAKALDMSVESLFGGENSQQSISEFSEKTYTIFRWVYVDGKTPLEVMRLARIPKASFEDYCQRIKESVAPELVRRGLFPLRLYKQKPTPTEDESQYTNSLWADVLEAR